MHVHYSTHFIYYALATLHFIALTIYMLLNRDHPLRLVEIVRETLEYYNDI